ncbi:hypothetical protein, partial [Pantoea sp. GbtcB22]|uniref:hypothetical protein n=1 Tax=Pantoea sp. GbtcB22 TaxID=2824767 RepID=UPI001C2F40EF
WLGAVGNQLVVYVAPDAVNILLPLFFFLHYYPCFSWVRLDILLYLGSTLIWNKKSLCILKLILLVQYL